MIGERCIGRRCPRSSSSCAGRQTRLCWVPLALQSRSAAARGIAPCGRLRFQAAPSGCFGPLAAGQLAVVHEDDLFEPV